VCHHVLVVVARPAAAIIVARAAVQSQTAVLEFAAGCGQNQFTA
jgi:hypothetical protein